MAGVIETYLAALDARLAFDPALQARVRVEVEDHLREAAEARGERDAVRRFGEPEAIARQFAADALGAQANRFWLTLVAAAGAAFLAMRLRRVLLDSAAFEAVPGAALMDRYAFIAAILIGIGGWLAIRAGSRLSRFRLAGAIGTVSCVALLVSIFGGAMVAIMAGRQFELPTLAALLLEIAMAVWLGTSVLGLQRRAVAAERALEG